MNGGTAIQKMLLAASATLSGSISNRVYEIIAPQAQSTMPYVVIECRNSEPIDSKSGKADTDIDHVSVFIFAETGVQRVTAATGIRSVLDFASGTFSPFTVINCRYQDQDDFLEEITNKPVHVREQRYLIRLKI